MAQHINAGDLRHIVTLQRQTGTDTDPQSGQLLDDWSDIGTYRAFVEPGKGAELVNAQQVKGLSYYLVTMRQVAPIYPNDRLVWKGTYLNIEQVSPVDGLNEFFILTATSQQGAS